jgi:hypothetical protein
MQSRIVSRGFSAPEEFVQDIHTLLQSLFHADIDGQTITEAAIDTAALDIVGVENEE